MVKNNEYRGAEIATFEFNNLKRHHNKQALLFAIMGLFFMSTGIFGIYFVIYDPSTVIQEDFGDFGYFIAFLFCLFIIFIAGFLVYFQLIGMRSIKPLTIYENGLSVSCRTSRGVEIPKRLFIWFKNIESISEEDNVEISMVNGTKRIFQVENIKEHNLILYVFKKYKIPNSHREEVNLNSIYFDRGKFQFIDEDPLIIKERIYGQSFRASLYAIVMIPIGFYFIIDQIYSDKFMLSLESATWVWMLIVGILLLPLIFNEIKSMELQVNSEGIRYIFDNDIVFSESWFNIDKVGWTIDRGNSFEIKLKNFLIPYTLFFWKQEIRKAMIHEIKKHARVYNFKIDERHDFE
jgi:hypothetical protein